AGDRRSEGTLTEVPDVALRANGGTFGGSRNAMRSLRAAVDCEAGRCVLGGGTFTLSADFASTVLRSIALLRDVLARFAGRPLLALLGVVHLRERSERANAALPLGLVILTRDGDAARGAHRQR